MQIDTQVLAHLERLLADAGLGEGVALRLCADDPAEVELAPDVPRPDDRVLRHAERAVLLLAPEVEARFAGGVLALDGGEIRLRWSA